MVRRSCVFLCCCINYGNNNNSRAGTPSQLPRTHHPTYTIESIACVTPTPCRNSSMHIGGLGLDPTHIFQIVAVSLHKFWFLAIANLTIHHVAMIIPHSASRDKERPS